MFLTQVLRALTRACICVAVAKATVVSYAQQFPRDFTLTVPLFSANSPWNQKADRAAPLPESEQQILVLYRVLLGSKSSMHPAGYGVAAVFPFMYVNYVDFTVPIFRSGAGTRPVLLRDYSGNMTTVNAKFVVSPDRTVSVPPPVGMIRPSAPENTSADGHLVLFDPSTLVSYDFWQVTTVRDSQGKSLGGGQVGSTILEAGAVDWFDVSGSGANPPKFSSARAAGTPLLAGLILPEEIERGSIGHALGFAIPGPRNTNAAQPDEPFSSDFFYPSSTTEANFFNTDPFALAAGQRIRLKQTVVDAEGRPVNEQQLAPITRIFLAALRQYGAYLVDNSGGFSFTAEDLHTALVRLSDDQIKGLIGQPAGAVLTPGKSKWQLLIEKLNADLEQIPLASGPWSDYVSGTKDPTVATFGTSNFEVIEPAAKTTLRRRAVGKRP